uniref:Uncharacterized protein n=1 Tax=Trichogramma kaykai TaxID=54128 RepID=A0ABD2WF24_9HYME
MMKLLLENGVNVNAKDKYGFSALNIAVSLLQYDAVYLLVKNGADVQSVTFQELGYFNYESHYELNLDLIESLMAILELLESKGFVLTTEDHKGVLRFLMGTKMIKDRELTPNACVLLLKSNLLGSHGSEDRYEFTLKLFLNTVRKFNIFLNEEKKNFLYKYLNSSPENLKSELLIFESKHEQEEFDLAKKTMISDKRSLYDLCVVNAKKRLHYLKNASYKEFLDEQNFNYRFGDTGKIIKGLIVESYRKSLFECIVMKYFQVLTLKKLPDLCCEFIIDFLSVDDLASVYEAVTNSKIKYSRALHW